MLNAPTVRFHRFLAVPLAFVLGTPMARADITLQNDGFASGDAADFMGGFVANEAAASRFLAPDAGRQLLKIQLLYGPATTQRTETFKVWDDTSGTNAPGAELLSADFMVTGSSSAILEVDLTSMNVIVPQQFRVGIVFSAGGNPSVAADTDGNIMPGKNFILNNGVTWVQAQTLGVPGDWIIRAVISGTSTGADAGVNPTPDASTVGATCTSNAQCSVGEFCDTTNHTCTFECRTNADCGNGGTCNSLGMCIGGGSKSGGCCSAGRGAQGSIALGLFTLGLLFRRRRRA